MAQAAHGFPFDVLVELMAAHDSQSLEGSPVERVEWRLSQSIELAQRAGLTALSLHLERCDLAWLCNARGIDRLSPAARVLDVDGVPVDRAAKGMDSHIRSHGASSAAYFPVIKDPSLTPGFVQHVPTVGERHAMVAKLQEAGRSAALRHMKDGATRH